MFSQVIEKLIAPEEWGVNHLREAAFILLEVNRCQWSESGTVVVVVIGRF